MATHPLALWLQGRPGGMSRLARAADLRTQTVSDIIKGRYSPRVETARRLSRATGGEVSAAAILGIDEHALTDGDEASPVNAARPSSEDAA